jgi:thiol-disulfide isomerase/thioredoxin
MPGGTEFPAFLETLVDFSRLEVLLSQESGMALLELPAEVTVKVFVTPTCGYCPGQMRLAYQAAMVSDKVRAEAIEVNEFPELGDAYKVQAVPLTVIGERVIIPGATPEKDFVEHVVKVAAEIAAEPAKDASAPVRRGEQRPSGLIIP